MKNIIFVTAQEHSFWSSFALSENSEIVLKINSTYLNANKIYLPSEYTDKDYNKLYQEQVYLL